MLLVRQGLLTTDELRRGVEALPGHADMSYYHRFYTIQIYVPGQKTLLEYKTTRVFFGTYSLESTILEDTRLENMFLESTLLESILSTFWDGVSNLSGVF